MKELDNEFKKIFYNKWLKLHDKDIVDDLCYTLETWLFDRPNPLADMLESHEVPFNSISELKRFVKKELRYLKSKGFVYKENN